jgi:hypothetical protein
VKGSKISFTSYKRFLIAKMSSDEPTNDNVVKKPDSEEKKDDNDPADGEELRFTPEEEEVGPFPF